jgi:hypothetical protein
MKEVPKPTKIYLGAEAFDMMKEALEFHQKYQWQPIESAPKDGTLFLGATYQWVATICWRSDGYCKLEGRPIDGYFQHGMGIGPIAREFDRTYQPTHWMPLPEPPKQ